jgi:protoporphyrin/coproporphyrin ferrochelatase
MKPALLLLNLGTPGAPTPEAVGPYLNEFLMDPFVIDIPAPLRWILVKVLIVPRRKHKSAEAYKTIWTTRGSPLLFYLRDLTTAVQAELGSEWLVEPAMRYGTPAIRPALEKLKSEGADSLVILPLYPQYAESSSRSSIDKVTTELAEMNWTPKLKVIRSFHDDRGHIDAWVELMREQMSAAKDGHVLFSYHGLPERHLKKSDSTGTYCLDGGQPTPSESESRQYACCEKALKIECPANESCYRAQSLETTHLIAEKLGLPRDRWSMSFQSRLGRTPWIKPYTDEVIPKLVASGVKSLIVVNPSFVADCLETIEEIGDRARETFLEAGGEEFLRIECLNARPSWAKAVSEMAKASID